MWKLPSLQSDRQRPQVPEGVRVYAVGDIHGRADLLAPVLLQIEIDIALHPVRRPLVVFLGDYIDRGPDSKEVLDLLIAAGHAAETVFLKGNHETFLLDFLKDPTLLERWRQFGGLETLVSYGLQPPIHPSLDDRIALARTLAGALPPSHRRFLEDLKTTFVCGDFLFVHAGLRPLVPIEQQAEEDLLWIRDDFLHWDKAFDKVVVHGHTPVLEPDIRFNRINIDTGAFATGRLSCLTIEAAEIGVLADARHWLGALPDIAAAPGEPLQDPQTIAAIHARRLKENPRLYDANTLARLDPRQCPAPS
ncbi:MAG: serine/threonine protein phosphatase [Afipia sp.]|nr:serine/threonine protein phosphatase [Afipia sp.]